MAGPKPCADCNIHEGVLDIRRRFLCHECFSKYVYQKTLKRMETYRLQDPTHDRPKVLLPLSGGPSSLSLLYTLDAQLQRQREKHNRAVYDLILLHIQTSTSPPTEEVTAWWANIAALFPAHTFLAPRRLHDISKADMEIEAELQHLGIEREKDQDDELYFATVLAKVKTSTARTDLQEILLQRLVIAIAKGNGCHGVVWGHSDSRLAAKALANVAKGRGGAIPDAIADGLSPHGIMFHYPQRDLFKAELDLYLHFVVDNLASYMLPTPADLQNPVSIRHTSIDDLLTTYITSQGQKYPGIMANVVRTAGKLQAPTNTPRRCALCVMPVTMTDATGRLCYGCERLKQDIIAG